MKRRKQPYQKKQFESTGISNDVSANLYLSMLTSPAWLDLSAQQKTLYVYCKLQLYAEKRKPTDDTTTFTMNQGKWAEKYKLYKTNNFKGFARDMAALIDHGFIICVASGAFTRTKSIYRFSSMWQHWGTEAFEISPTNCTLSMVRKIQAKKE